MKNILIFVVITLAFGIGFVYSNSMTVIAKDIATANTLMVLEREIRNFANDKKRIPDSLQELVAVRKIDSETCNDRWNEKIEYVIINSNTVSLISMGNPSIRHNDGFKCAISNTFSINFDVVKRDSGCE